MESGAVVLTSGRLSSIVLLFRMEQHHKAMQVLNNLFQEHNTDVINMKDKN
jgi:hypothetical protein